MTTPDLDRLRTLLLIALQSTHDGEVTGAIGAMRKVLKKGGVDAHWLADRLNGGASLPPPPPVYEAASYPGEQLDYINSNDQYVMMLSDREIEFIISLNRQRVRYSPWSPSPKQAKWLGDIYARIKRASGD